MWAFTKGFLRERHGATAIEYGLIAAVISLVIMSGVQMTGNSLQNIWVSLADKIDSSWQD